LSRWNSFSSATSGHSGPLSVMDILNLWNDDPEEVLLDLGFGCDEPDLSGRIPARFINHQSQARGINLQVFLEAQKNRLDLENPDVSNRFRQLEVLQQVTTAFSSLVGPFSSPLREAQGKELPTEARERRRRVGMLFRRASKKSLSQIHKNKTQDQTTPAATSPRCAAPESLQPLSDLEDKKVPLKSSKPGHQEVVGLSPLEEEQGTGLDPQAPLHMPSLTAPEGALRPSPLRDGQSLTANTILQRKKSPVQLRESFEMEEATQGVMRTNSCQSDSSGFLEELSIPSLSQQASPGSDVIKALSGLSGGSTDSQSKSEESPENSLFPGGPAAPDSFSSTGRAVPSSSSTTVETGQTSTNATASSEPPSSSTLESFPPPTTILDLKPSARSVSVQMSSSPSSHIVQRKDIPYPTDSKPILLPSVLPLDTSTPFRAVQSWTDLQIQRNALTKKLSYGPLHIVPNNVTVSMSALETTQGPTLIFSSSPSVPLLCNDEQSHDCLPGIAREYHTGPVCVDKGLWTGEEEEVDRIGNEDEEMLWEGNQSATMACCDHQCTCCTEKSYKKQQTVGNIPYSLDELEEMLLCLQQFCSVLSNMEEQLSEDQAAVYSSLSDQDRERVREIEELRRAVKQEAAELEMQLNELAHHYDDSLKMKMHRLLDEQSLLCSQLRVFLPGSSPASNRTVATQCCLQPWIPPAGVPSSHVSSWSTWNVDSPRQSPPGSESMCEGLGCAPTKADKLDIVGFLQRLKDSLRHSVNTDSLE
ncbi:uncharacterized protein itprid1, partial [Symphorus nematophorus]